MSEAPGSPPTATGQVGHLARQSGILVFSGLIGYVAALALSVMVARKLGAEEFGAWVVAYSVAQTLAALGLLGADWIVLRQGSYYHSVGDRARLRGTIHLALLLTSTVSVLLGAATVALAPVIARVFFNSPSMVPLLRVAGLMVPVMALGQVMLFGTQAFKQMRDVAVLRNILAPLARLAFIAVALVVVGSTIAAFAALLLAELALSVAATVALHRRISLVGPTEPIERRGLIRFALPVWGNRLSEVSRTQVFPLFLGSMASLEASGVFVAARRIAQIPGAIINSMNQVYAPMASALYLQGNREQLRTLFRSLAKWSFMLGVPIFLLLTIFPAEILSLFGPEFRSGAPALVVLAVGILFQFGTGPVTVTLVVIGRPRLALIDYLAVIATEIGLALVLIPPYGVVGAAIASTVGKALNNVLPMIQVYRAEGVQPYERSWWKPICAGLAAALLARIVASVTTFGGVLEPLIATAVIAVVYVGLLLLFGVSEEDRAAIQALVQRRARRAPLPEASGTQHADEETAGEPSPEETAGESSQEETAGEPSPEETAGEPSPRG
jgi:O-antigen/teichoic acid export membrane protein